MLLSGPSTGTVGEVFQSCFERNLVFVLVFFTTLCDWLAKLVPLSQPMRTKPTVTHSHSFSRAFPSVMHLLRIPIGSLCCLRLL